MNYRVRIQFDVSDVGKAPSQDGDEYLFNTLSVLLGNLSGVKNAAIGIETLDEEDD